MIKKMICFGLGGVLLCSSVHATAEILNSKIDLAIGTESRINLSIISPIAELTTMTARVGEKNYQIESVVYPSGTRANKNVYQNELRIFEVDTEEMLHELGAVQVYVEESSDSTVRLTSADGQALALDLVINPVSADEFAKLRAR